MRPFLKENDQLFWYIDDLDRLPETGGQSFSIEGHEVAAFRFNDGAIVIDNICPHQGQPLCEGVLDQGFVICPRHAWRFSATDGKGPEGETYKTNTYPTLIRDGRLYASFDTTL